MPPEWSKPITDEQEHSLAAALIERGVGEKDALFAIENKMQRCAVFWWSSQDYGRPHGGSRGRHWEGLPGWYFAKNRDGTTDEVKYCREEFEYDRVEFKFWGWCEVTRTAMYYTEIPGSYRVNVPFCALKAELAQMPTSRQLGSALNDTSLTHGATP